MFAGRVGQWERLQYRLRIENPQVTHLPGKIDAALLVPIGLDITTRYDWFRMFLTYKLIDDASTYELTYIIGLGDQEYGQAIIVSPGTQEILADWIEPRWYASYDELGNLIWLLTWQDLRIYINDTEISHPFRGAGSVATPYFAPAGLPIGAAELVAESQYGYIDLNDYDFCSESFTLTSISTARVVGGYRVRVNGEWQAFPIFVPMPPVLPDPCGTGLSAPPPTIEGENTWNLSIQPHEMMQIHNVYHGIVRCICKDVQGGPEEVDINYATTTAILQIRRGSVLNLPNLPHEFVPIGENIPHEYLMYRAKLPGVEATRTVAAQVIRMPWFEPAETLCDVSVSEPYTLHVPRDELLFVHDGNATNPLGDGLHEPVYCLPKWSSHDTKIIMNLACGQIPCIVLGISGNTRFSCPVPFDFEERIFELVHTQDYVVDGNCLPYYRHYDYALRYLNTRAATFWSYIAWLQDWLLDRDGDGVAEPVALSDYWQPHQCQHIDHPALPPSIRSNRRSYLLLDTLANGTWSGWIYWLFGLPTGWVGSQRPAVVEWLPAGEHALTQTSQPRWSATNATLVFTAMGITVTPTDTTHTLEFTLADWETEPYLYPAVADRVRIWLPDTAYTRIEIQLVSAENETVTIATTRGTHPIPHGTDSHYAGTWHRQYAAMVAGYSELGLDWDTDGVSPATFSDPKRALLWQLLGARAGAKLRITITQTTPTPYTMEYPRFYRDPLSNAFVLDNGAHTFPHIRNTQTLNWGLLEYPTASNTPTVRPPHQSMTLYDAAALYMQLQLAEDASSTAAIMNQILNWGFDEVETGGFPAGVPRVQQMCRAAMLPYHSRLALWLINDLRECPPLPTLPTRRLNTITLQFSEEWGQWVYFAAPSNRYYLHPDADTHLWRIDNGSETQLTTADRIIGRYHITKHDRPVDNTETLQHPTRQWRIRVGTRTLARTTPFFGHACISHSPAIPDIVAIPLTISALRDRLYFATQKQNLEFVTLPMLQNRTLRNTPKPIYALEVNDRTDKPQILIGYKDENSVALAILPGDETITEIWTMPGKQILVLNWGEDYALYAWILGTDNRVRLRISRDNGLTWSAPIDCTLDQQPFDADTIGDCTVDKRYHCLYLTYKRDQTVAIARSTNGTDWQTVLT